MTGSPPFWRFLPEEAAPDADSLNAVKRAGRGAFARTLREARHVLGSQRAATLLREVGGEGRAVTLLVIAAFQPRAIEDALQVAFAVAGLRVQVRAIDGFGAIESADEATFRNVDAIFVPLLRAVDGPALDLRTLAEAISRRCNAPLLLAEAGGDSFARSHRSGAAFTSLPLDGPAIDERFGRTFGAIPTAEAADRLADAAAGFASGIAGTAPKLIVTDLDGTLWRGVVGEAGPEGIELHRLYAEALKNLSSRGFVLAIASRNEASDVEAAFAAHPDWPIRRSDFAAVAVGWGGKDQLAEDVLRRLDLGPEHMLVVDDDPVNCARLAERFPEADIRLFGHDWQVFAAALSIDPLLQGMVSATSDRTEQYHRREQVEHLRSEAPSTADFLRRLQTKLMVVPLEPALLPRAAELASRVNQFALNDRRPGVAELAERNSPLDFMVQLDDAFGLHGLVGLVLAHAEGEVAVVDAFFLSCRAFGRGIEDAMLLALRKTAGTQGCDRLTGVIEHLPRNEPARRCFSPYLDAGGCRTWTITVGGSEATPEGVTILWA